MIYAVLDLETENSGWPVLGLNSFFSTATLMELQTSDQSNHKAWR